MHASNLLFPKKSHRKLVNLPDKSEDLAELMGIIYGDGAIGNRWQIVISLNSISDEIYSKYVSNLFTRLFGISASVRKRPNQNTLVVVCSSITVVDYLVDRGAARGSKIMNKLIIPPWILKNSSFTKVFIRGLIDTDGCIYMHKHFTGNKYYVNIGLCFTNFSTDLVDQVDKVFQEYGINSHKSDKNRRIYLYSKKAVEKYLLIFGSSNPRIKDKYKNWWDVRVA